MFHDIFRGLFDSSTAAVISISDFFLCLLSALAIGLILTGCYMYRTRYTKSFVATMAILPAVVCMIIMMVNGNVGAGVAVAGAFSLVRFRSVAGSAKEIGAIFLAMGTGLVIGMGYIAYAFLFSLILGAVTMFYSHIDFGAASKNSLYKVLHITIPEDLDYTGVFDEILQTYTSAYELTQIKTTNMGSLFRLTYSLTLRSADKEKELIDKLRCRNGNLEITVSKQESMSNEL